MLNKRRGGKNNYSPYSVGLRGKKSKSKCVLDVFPSRPKELPRKDQSESPLVPSSATADVATGNASRLSSSPSGVSTLKRPTTLSRHSSAAGFSMPITGTWGYSKGYKSSPTSNPDSYEVPDVEDIPQLLHHVSRFSEAVEKLKDIVLGEEEEESRRPVAHEALGEVLWVLRQIIGKYPLLNTVETLTAAGTLISKVKGFHYESSNEADKLDFDKTIETIAVAFSSNVSDFLMGEMDSSTLLSLPPADKSRSMENLCGGITADMMPAREELSYLGSMSAEEVDIMLQRSEGGVEAALQYAKTISKYLKDLIYYLEKRTVLEMEFAKGLTKLIHTCRPLIAQECHVPFQSIYSLALEQDLEHGNSMMQTAIILQNQTFLQPLTMRRLEHEKRRKEIKDQWHRAQRKLQEAESNLKKARQAYLQRSDEHEKAKQLTVKAEEDVHGTSSSNASKALDKRRRMEDEARNKAEEAEATYRTCIADAKTQKQELEDVKVNVLRQLQEVIKQSDQILKSASISYYQIMHMQTAPLPVHFQTLCESSKLYDPGQQYASYVRGLQMEAESEAQYDFEPSPHFRTRKGSFGSHDFASNSSSAELHSQSSVEEPGSPTSKASSALAERRGVRGHQLHKSWPTTMTETDGVGGGSSLDSPSSAAGDFSRKLPRIPSSGTISFPEESADKDGSSSSFEQSINGMAPEMAVPTGPFRNVRLSRAAQTHRLKKLRTPSKCRECDSYVYFQGAECEECNLACHRKCLETLAIQCGHKKLQRKLQLFGREFARSAQDSSDGIPFIIKKCISEIESRALHTKGIYRVNGVKTRVEKLCQAFENGKELVELSQASPHDISNVLKLYLRQLPEPLMLFRLYHDLMGLAKESKQGTGEGHKAKGLEIVDKGPQTDKEVVAIVSRLKDLLQDLPSANKATLRYIIGHLSKIAELEQSNKMSSSNLGIVFGPTLMRPRPTEATVSLSSLVDYPHQARILELLIVFYTTIFEVKERELATTPGGQSDSSEQKSPSEGYSEADSSPAPTQSAADSPGLDKASEFPRDRLSSIDRVDPQCGNSQGSERSLGSRERSLDSDSELDDAASESGVSGPGSGARVRGAEQTSVSSTDGVEEEEEEEEAVTGNLQDPDSDPDLSQTEDHPGNSGLGGDGGESEGLPGDPQGSSPTPALVESNTNQSNNVRHLET
ncbi:rho GTPase-activating protein 45 isoform X2 [Callorhinchus milii]|uniref:rho GTPase-activating protein 45 isoform X2 n=1 Tax=Callorhinchus milii TaxID=7868 RepID=UPI001C3FE5A0|nr:rho GTPase-activating protein 45 isoform X2 [Callorhinchus milii]